MALCLARGLVIWLAVINLCSISLVNSELHVGPWGGRGGDLWTYDPKGVISHVTITYDDVVRSICFASVDENGNLDKSEFPCKKAAKTAEISINVQTEKLNGISGTFHGINKCSKTITSLSFTTNSNKTYGPFGTVEGTAFSLAIENEGFSGFHGSTGWLLDSIGVNLANPSTGTGTTEDVGPWGGDAGVEYEYMPTGEISTISIRYEGGSQGAVHAITVTSKNKDGSLSSWRTMGGPGDYYTLDSQIDLAFYQGEKLVGISGTYGIYHTYMVITSLTFYSNKDRFFGPYGSAYGTYFSYKANQNRYIAGFYGHEGGLLDSIGLHVKTDHITFGQWGNANAGNSWTYEPNEGISHISITYGVAVYSINFTRIDGNGTTASLKKSGKDIGLGKAEIDIDPKNEKLRGISGTVGAVKGWEVITSLTFFTDNNRTFGPYGIEMGTAFSAPLTDGFISGFHGSSGKWLEAIGIYAMPAFAYI